MTSGVLLNLIWWTSATLIAVSMIAMLVLILRRFRTERRAVWWKERRKKLMARLLAALDEGDTSVDDWSDLTEADLRLAHEILYDMTELTRGDSQHQMVVLLDSIGGREAGIRQLTSKRESTRILAATNLAYFRGPDVEGALRRAMEDRSAHVRMTAAASLHAIGSVITLKDLVAHLAPDLIARSRRMRELFRTIGAQNVDDMMGQLATTNSVPLRLLIIDALGASQSMQASTLIIEQTQSPDVDVRAEAFRALTSIGHPGALNAVLRGLKDDAWEVRTQAAVCAGKVGLDDTVASLTRLLDDDKWWVRFRAAQALYAIQGPGRAVIVAAAEETPGYSIRAVKIASLVLLEKAA